jgi:hypothetical protein
MERECRLRLSILMAVELGHGASVLGLQDHHDMVTKMAIGGHMIHSSRETLDSSGDIHARARSVAHVEPETALSTILLVPLCIGLLAPLKGFRPHQVDFNLNPVRE